MTLNPGIYDLPAEKYSLGGVWDYRDDPEGMLFGGGYGADAEKATRVDREWDEHAEYRQRTLGFVVQPPEWGKAGDGVG